MYTDHVFFLTGALASVLFLLLTGYLIVTRKRGRLFRNILVNETEASAAISVLTRTQPIMTMQTLLTEATRLTESTELSADATEFEGDYDDPNRTQLDDAYIDPRTGGGYAFTEPQAVPTPAGLNPIGSFNPEILRGQYTLLGEIGGGGMSRVFLARKDNVGNEWIVKYVPAHIGELSAEADILTSLNHISLPKIIDIMHDHTGSYMVVSYVEGTGMNTVLKSMRGAHEFVVADWAQQLAQVLAYLHKSGPVYHLDLKPANIMVTADNKLVLIDFGISRRASDDGDSLGVTVAYAAPEQLKGRANRQTQDIITRRFGNTLPEVRQNWTLDERTDIYSFGVIMFEAAVGHIPTYNTLSRIHSHLTPGMSEIVLKCLQINPADRFQSTDDLLAAITKQRTGAKPAMVRTLFLRRAAMAATALFLLLAFTGFGGGMRVRQAELSAYMYIAPAVIVVSLQQDSVLQITRYFPHTGREQPMDAAFLRWEYAGDNIAQIDGNRIVGLNVGQTEFHGMYRNAEVTLQVTVVEPIAGMVDIALRYFAGGVVQRFAGTAYRDLADGTLTEMEMIGPESLALTADGTLYFTDRGRLRRITPQGITQTIITEQRIQRLRACGNSVYLLTDPWWDQNDSAIFAFKRITAAGTELITYSDAHFTNVRDFYVKNGIIYFIEWNYGGGTRLRAVDPQAPENRQTLVSLPDTASALTVAAGGRVFITDAETGVILVYENDALHNLAGIANERHFIDGTAPLFYRPAHIRYRNGYLYLWDFNVLRRLSLANGIVREAITLAGMASPVYSMDFEDRTQAEHTILPHSHLTEFLHTHEGILISDPKRGVLWKKTAT
ncbi:MAG: serine/threonine-protein kinase [Defluviitaleaceae bacterium]|nr:serine/threonine-protein kinase [Defluviitaleaceae bacterium]MCL2274511.1 serine/threonine-protein kinase [Defluviitaleaceae bacterium]